MALTPGTRIGPYEVVAQIGVGGMGEVYRARDTKLNRDVAIKVLPEAFTADTDRLARFRREAQVLAALNHPGIAAIYGFEDSSATHALVMELVEGPTLADRIAQGPIPIDDALPIAKQVAEALESAHEQGIVHRDLKPANIKVRSDGTVKILDFGLAKALEPAGAAGSPSATMSPTITTPAMTQMGMILGTAAYMSPEQARGKPVDRRTDIWVFGCVLYEMLTGRRAFDGEDVGETIAAVIRAEPDWAGVPARVRPLLESCFEKDPRRRLRDIGDAWRLVGDERDWLPIRTSRLSPLLWAAAALLFIALAAILAWSTARPRPQPAPAQFTIGPAPAVTFRYQFTGASVSRDGRLVVFSGVDGTPQRNDLLYVRPIDSLDARPLPGTGHADHPFWSPDSRTIVYFSDDKLKRIDLAGGGVSTLADAPGGNGGDWNANGVLLYAASGGLYTVPAAGGVPAIVIPAPSDQSGSLLFPQFLPDGDRFLYLGVANIGAAASRIWVSSLSHPEERKALVESAYKAAYAAGDRGGTGWLLFVHGTTLLSQPFDLGALALRGDPVPITADLRAGNHWAAFWAADARVLMFRGGGSTFDRSTLVWMGRDGRRLGEVAPEGTYSSLRLSPDGDRIAIGIRDGVTGEDQWIIDSARHTTSRFTFDAARETSPAWSPDGRQIAFSANRSRTYQLFLKDARGVGAETQASTAGEDKTLTDWSPDGRYLLYSMVEPGNRDDILAWPLTGNPKPVPVVRTPFEDTAGQFSPDGRWIVYQSTETGRPEVYLQSFPSSGGKWQVSNSGGRAPRWRADGKELFYLTPEVDSQDLMAVDVELTPGGPQLGTPHRLFSVSISDEVYPYDVTRDGQRFLIEQLSQQSAGPPLTVMLNWPALRLEP